MGLTERDRKKLEQLRERIKEAGRPVVPEPRDERFKPIDPMLAETFEGELDELHMEDWFLERKYDGTRIILERFGDAAALYTRRHVERSKTLPNIVRESAEHVPNATILDGEAAFTNEEGFTTFRPIHTTDPGLKPVLYIFDILLAEGENVERIPLRKRKELLEGLVEETEHIKLSPVYTDRFQERLEEFVEHDEEGAMIKRRNSQYLRNTRSPHWQKIKPFIERDVLAVGYTKGEGNREGFFGALVMSDGETCLGRVGSGFTRADLERIISMVEPVAEKPFPVERVGRPYTPVEPFVIQVKYQEVLKDGKLRAPVFLHLRPEKPAEDVQKLHD